MFQSVVTRKVVCDSAAGLDAYYYKNNRNKKQKFLKIDVDVGMKKAQKQEIIQDARRFGVLYPFLHFTE